MVLGGHTGVVSTAGELGVEGEAEEDVGERECGGRGRFGGSLTMPSKGGGTPGVPGRWRGGTLRGPKGSLTVPGRGNLGGSPSNDDMRGGAILAVLDPPRSGPSGLTGRGSGRGRSTGTNTPPTMTAEGTGEWRGGVEGCWGKGGGGGLGMGRRALKKGDVGGGCW